MYIDIDADIARMQKNQNLWHFAVVVERYDTIFTYMEVATEGYTGKKMEPKMNVICKVTRISYQQSCHRSSFCDPS